MGFAAPPAVDSVQVRAARPVGDRLLVKAADRDRQSPGGVWLPETMHDNDPPQCGVVIAKGDGSRAPDGSLIPVAIEVGDTIIYSRYSGSDIQIDDTDLVIIRESDVFLRLPAGTTGPDGE